MSLRQDFANFRPSLVCFDVSKPKGNKSNSYKRMVEYTYAAS